MDLDIEVILLVFSSRNEVRQLASRLEALRSKGAVNEDCLGQWPSG